MKYYMNEMIVLPFLTLEPGIHNSQYFEFLTPLIVKLNLGVQLVLKMQDKIMDGSCNTRALNNILRLFN